MPKRTTDTRARALQALELRKGGAQFQAIADQLGYNSQQAAHKAVTSLLKRTEQQAADDLRQLALLRYEQMLLAVWPDVVKGKLEAIDRALKIEAAIARLLGLDAPIKQEHSGSIEVSDAKERLAARIVDIADRRREKAGA